MGSHDYVTMASVLSIWISVLVCFSFPQQVLSHAASRYITGKPHNTVGSTCGDSYCNNDCCIDSSTENLICCDDESEDYLWWFWIAFLIVILVLSMCFGACCCKIRRAQSRRHYLVVTQEHPRTVTTYGTESIAPVLRGIPPGYPQAKLPSYTPVAEDKGNPPPYQ